MQSPPLKDGTQPSYIEPVHPDLRTAQAARKWQCVDAAGNWPDADECNDEPEIVFAREDGVSTSAAPVAPLRQGDIVLWPLPADAVRAPSTPLTGASLAVGTATGHSHTIVPASAAKRSQRKADGAQILHLTADAELVHDEHCTVPLRAGTYLVSHKRRYDRENGWAPVED
jgi:hypothetical protein